MPRNIESSVRDDVQGLRAVAVLAVVIFHLERSWLPGGYLGVDIFFVISGFVITQMLLRERPGAEALFRFYCRRIRRIVPAYVVLLLVVTLAAAVLLTAQDFTHYWASLKSALQFTSNRHFSEFGEYFAPQSTELPLLHLWSIAVEMQFYLLFPLLLFVLPKRLQGAAFLLLLLVASGYAALEGIDAPRPEQLYFGLTGRIPEFLIGAAIAASRLGDRWSPMQRESAAVLGVGVLAAALVFLKEGFPHLALVSLIPCIGIALIIAARDSAPSRVLSSVPFVWIGAISYSMYLWHWPLFAFTRYYQETYKLPLLTMLVVVTATFAMSWLSFRFIESPFRAPSAGKRRLFAALALVGATVGGILFSPSLNARIEPARSENQLRYAPAGEICHGTIVGDCLRGALDSEREWLLLGDSHAAQLNYFFDVVGRANGFKVRVITGSSCVTIAGFDVQRIPAYARRACVQQIQQARTHIDSASVVAVAGMWQYHATSPEFWAALRGFLADMEGRGKSVVVFAQVPMLDTDPIRAQRFADLGAPKKGATRQDWAAANCRLQLLVAEFRNAIYFDLSENRLFYPAAGYDPAAIYFDRSHLNEAGALLYGEAAKKLLVPGALTSPTATPCKQAGV